jgi:pilus assembly protein Flp/PilA
MIWRDTNLKTLKGFNTMTNFLNDESGAAAAEYALILALIAVVIIGTLTTLGTNISTVFSKVAATLSPAS